MKKTSLPSLVNRLGLHAILATLLLNALPVQADPGGELSANNRQSKLLAKYYPELSRALQQFPADLPDGTESRFFRVNRKVEKRPTPVLTHRLIHSANDRAVMIQREFYVGHSYNSSQVVAGSPPCLDGALVVYALQSSTDQVAGVGQALKHSIGREQLNREIVNKFQRLKATAKG